MMWKTVLLRQMIHDAARWEYQFYAIMVEVQLTQPLQLFFVCKWLIQLAQP
jgi:hypothetical protein